MITLYYCCWYSLFFSLFVSVRKNIYTYISVSFLESVSQFVGWFVCLFVQHRSAYVRFRFRSLNFLGFTQPVSFTSISLYFRHSFCFWLILHEFNMPLSCLVFWIFLKWFLSMNSLSFSLKNARALFFSFFSHSFSLFLYQSRVRAYLCMCVCVCFLAYFEFHWMKEKSSLSFSVFTDGLHAQYFMFIK